MQNVKSGGPLSGEEVKGPKSPLTPSFFWIFIIPLELVYNHRVNNESQLTQLNLAKNDSDVSSELGIFPHFAGGPSNFGQFVGKSVVFQNFQNRTNP